MQDRIDILIAEIAEAHHGHFTSEHLRELNVSAHERKYRLGVGRWVLVHERVYRISGTPTTWRGSLLAACWAGGMRAVSSHRSAAELWELPGRSCRYVEITCPRWRRARHDGLVVHESRALPDDDTTFVDGIPVTTPTRTIFDLAGISGLTTVDLAIDNALRRELTTFPQLRETLTRLARRGRPGTQLFRKALADRDPDARLSANERERLLFRMLRRHGFPMPIAQYEIRDEAGNVIARPDFAYPDLKIAIEYESFQEHTGKLALVRDSARRNAVVALGWAPIAATAVDLRSGGAQLATELRRTRAQRSGVEVGE